MFDLPSRQVIKEHEFDEQLLRLLVNEEEADDFIAAAEDILARDPRAGMPAIEDGSVWYLVMAPVRGDRVSLFYAFDEKTVTLLSILPFDDERRLITENSEAAR